MITETLTEENFLLECARHYRNKQCQNTEEFFSDLQHIKYIKKLITRYQSKNVLDERLVLNHIVILNNVFGPVFLCRIFFLKLLPQMPQIKPFLLYLGILSDVVENVNSRDYDTIDIEMDWTVVEKLRFLDKLSRL